MRKVRTIAALCVALATTLAPSLQADISGAARQALAAQARSTTPSLLTNGSFDQTGSGWLAPWTLSVTSPAAAAISQDTTTASSAPASVKITVTQAVPSAAWDVALAQSNLSLTANTTYDLTFWAKSSAGQSIQAAVQQTVAPFTARAKQWFTLSPTWQQYTLTYTAAVTEGSMKVQFNVGAATGSIWLDSATFTARAVDPTATGTNTAMATASSTATPTSVPPTATATDTATSVPPTDTDTATAVPPTDTDTATPVPPTDTDTATSTNTATSTPVPPTATATASPVPPTDTDTVTPVPPSATDTATPVPPTATATVSTGAATLAGSVQDFPRLGNLNAFTTASQAGTFSRYGLVVAPLSAAAGVSALTAQSTGTKAIFYFNTSSVNVANFSGMTIYPGWWLTLAGTTLTGAINASTTTIPVANAALISANLASNPDVLVDNESMHVTSVNTSAHTLTVQRGYYSTATSHSAGARLAAHASKWAGAWMLNLTSYCPANPSTGQTWLQYAVAQVRADLAAAPWDGVFLDDANSSFTQISAGQLDANNDNVADGGNGPSGTAWASGELGLFSALHSAQPSALLVGNGGYYLGQSAGREMERFPVYDNGWASGFTTYLSMAGPGAPAPDTILNADTANTGTQSLQSMRFNLGTALMGNGYYAYDYGTLAHGQTWWYDEFDNGAGSSLAAQITSNQTSIPLASGTGSRFKSGDIVRVPNSLYSTAQPGALDDEQMQVTGVSGDTLSVRRGYNGSLATWHPAATKVLTQAQITAGQGWLGQPLGAGALMSLQTPNLLQDGDFETAGSGWLSPWSLSTTLPAAASVSQDSSTSVGGSASAKVTVSQAVPSAGWDVALTQQGFSLVGGSTYTLTFSAKGSAGQVLNVAFKQTVSPFASRASQYYTLTGSWQPYTLTFTSPVTESTVKVAFNLGAATGTVWLDSASLQLGDPNVWRRDFTHGTVLLNATNAPQTVTLGSGYQHILGTQDPATNSGAAVSVVTIPAQDAVLLDKTSS